MSWSNVLPWWVYASEVEEHQALMLGAFLDELRAEGVLEASLITWLISVAAFMCSSWICDFTFIPD